MEASRVIYIVWVFQIGIDSYWRDLKFSKIILFELFSILNYLVKLLSPLLDVIVVKRRGLSPSLLLQLLFCFN